MTDMLGSLYGAVSSSGRRRVAHAPGIHTHAGLVQLADRVHENRLVVLTTGDRASHSLVLNWLQMSRRASITNTIVLCWDTALFSLLQSRRIASYDDSANLAAWAQTHIERPLQRIFMERFVAVASLVLAGFDVVHTDADAVFLRDWRPFLRSLPADTHMFAQRDLYPELMVDAMGGYTACMGFIFFRSSELVARFLDDSFHRAQAHAYRTTALFQYAFNANWLRWQLREASSANVSKQKSWSRGAADHNQRWAVSVDTDATINQTTFVQARLSPWPCGLTANRSACPTHFRGFCDRRGVDSDRPCLKLGLLPHNAFVRYALANASSREQTFLAPNSEALVYHPLTNTGRHEMKRNALHALGLFYSSPPAPPGPVRTPDRPESE